jgi:hypothetical protein
LIPTLIMLVYRVVIGWTTIAASQPINHVIWLKLLIAWARKPDINRKQASLKLVAYFRFIFVINQAFLSEKESLRSKPFQRCISSFWLCIQSFRYPIRVSLRWCNAGCRLVPFRRTWSQCWRQIRR